MLEEKFEDSSRTDLECSLPLPTVISPMVFAGQVELTHIFMSSSHCDFLPSRERVHDGLRSRLFSRVGIQKLSLAGHYLPWPIGRVKDE